MLVIPQDFLIEKFDKKIYSLKVAHPATRHDTLLDFYENNKESSVQRCPGCVHLASGNDFYLRNKV